MRRYTIAYLHEYVASKGGKCLSNSYTNQYAKYWWECECGNRWETTFKNILEGCWCPKCGIEKRTKNLRKYSISMLNEIANKKGGKCLSTEYINPKQYLLWECQFSHKWKATAPSVVLQRHWCKKCADKKRGEKLRKYTNEMVKNIVKKRGGTLLSEYTAYKTTIKIRCANGHEWGTSMMQIKKNRWCPYCTLYVCEEKCRLILEELTGEKFPKSRKILPNNLELDGFCEKLNIAFEFNGKQHYHFIEFFHRTEDNFKSRKQTDKTKIKLCEEKGINLIIISYKQAQDSTKLKKFIHSQLLKLKCPVVKHINNIYLKNIHCDKLQKLKEIAIEKGGKCLSEEYQNNSTHLMFQCARRHIWLAVPLSVVKGHWCPFCRGRGRTITDMQELAKSRNGFFLSDYFNGVKTIYDWMCSEGHVWSAAASSVIQGMWCRKCATKRNADKKRFGVDKMHELAKSRGMEFLAETYIDSQTKYPWRCICGRIWCCTPYGVKRGSHCNECKKKKIKEMIINQWKERKTKIASSD